MTHPQIFIVGRFEAAPSKPLRSSARRCKDPEGNGYRYLTDKVMEVAAFNPYVANGYVAQEAYLDYKNLPEPQKSKMREQLERLRDTPEVPARIRETATNFLTEGAIS